ncbi:MAG: hypothetical protein ABIE07_09150 [Candidatus Zixiibacteriota bacterium]
MSIFSSITGFIGDNLLALAGGIWALAGIIISYVSKKYLIPMLNVDKKRKYAAWIAAIADELTDDLVARYPDKKWIEELDKAVDKIIEICGINKDVAERAIRAAATRKA